MNSAQHGDRLAAARRLHGYLVRRHWREPDLVGPDPGVRWNYRLGRHVKSAVPWWPWRDDLVYLQGLGYWVIGNWHLAQLADTVGRRGDARSDDMATTCRAIALSASDGIVARQDGDGGWPYPNPEWRGRVATAEGTWACLGLLASYRAAGDTRYLDAALRWYRYVEREVGFQRREGTQAVNYFAGRTGPRIPNNAAFYLRFVAELASATGDDAILERGEALVAFLESVQVPSGEFPYAVEGDAPGRLRPHFQCFQYNAYMVIDLWHYARIVGDERAGALARRSAAFVMGGIRSDGAVAYACHEPYRTVCYHAAVAASALEGIAEADESHESGLMAQAAAAAFGHVLARQRSDGGFPHSRGDYRWLSDRRSYPRYLAMILVHLVEGLGAHAGPAAETAALQRERFEAHDVD